jgi:azurin
MKSRLLLVSVCSAFLFAGCGQKETASAPAAPAGGTAAAPAAAPAAATAPAAAPRVIEITANDTMKFNVTAIDAKVGETLKIVLTNIGVVPKEAMGHNLVVLKPGTDAGAFAGAAMMARDTDYIPAQLKDQVIAHTAVLGPRKSDEITFKVTAAGEYAYICSFPAHFGAGMKGVITVK